MPPSLTPDQIIPSGFTENLGTDYIAVNPAGHVIGRASTKEALERANPDAAAFFTGADFEDPFKMSPLLTPEEKEALGGAVAFGDTEASFGPNGEGSPRDSELRGVAEEPAAVVAEEPAAVVAEEPVTEEPKSADGSAFDHDKDGKVGGGAKNRQRKPSGK